MTKVGTVVCAALIVLGLSCASDRKAPRHREAGKKSPSAAGALPSVRPTTATAPARSQPTTAPTTAAVDSAAGTAKANAARARLLLEQVASALDMFNLHIGRYPATEEGLQALVVKPAFDDEAEALKWVGPYLTKLPTDPWGRPIHYQAVEDPNARRPYKAWSAGPDGRNGTDDDIRTWRDD